MRNTKYERIANKHKPYEDRIGNSLIAFVCGGIIGLLGEVIIELLVIVFNLDRVTSSTIMIIIFIFLASLSTALGFFDTLVTKYKCGLLIPITGFAHAMTSSSLDYKNEGPIYGIGSNMFKLAGSVIIYGVASAFFFSLIRYIIGGI